jgi:hypothetical protein
MTMRSIQKQYYHELKKQLPCSAAQKKLYLAELDRSVTAFVQQHPNAALSDLYTAFGDPHTIADSFLEQADAQSYQRQLSLTRKIAGGVLSIVAVLAIALGVIAYLYADALQDYFGGYYVETIETLPEDAEPLPSPLSVH